MAASTNDYFKKTGSSTVTTLSAPGKALGATSLTVGSTTNYPSDTGIIVAIRVVDTAGELVAGTYTEWSATVSSGTSLAIVATPVYGSDQVYAAGSTTQVYIPLSSYAHNKVVDGVLSQHKQTGEHADTITTNTINENTAANGVTIDGLNIKDGALNTANSVPNSALAGGITPSKLATGVATSVVSTDEDVTSATYVNLPTNQSVTVTIGSNGIALVAWACGLYNATTPKLVSVAVSGATTIAANDTISIRNEVSAFQYTQSTFHLFTGLNQGSTTFTLQARTSSGTAKVFDRRLIVLPL